MNKTTKKSSNHVSKQPKCFVVMPFGEEGTEKRKEYSKVYNYIIKDTVEQLGYECIRGDEIPDSGMITIQIKHELQQSELVIADLTDKNPNVLYEVGFRHALNMPIVSLSQDVKGLPFDIAHYRTIPYNPRDLESVSECKKLLTQYIVSIKKISNEQTLDITNENKPFLFTGNIEIGLENIYRIMSDLTPQFDSAIQNMNKVSQKCRVIHNEEILGGLANKIDNLISSSEILVQMSQLGLVGIHKNRMDAIEQYFFNIIRDEITEIDIVGSTIFGLKGYRNATFEKILSLLQDKKDKGGFKIRILLTHWDTISYRQEQEKTEKNIARYVIAKELKDAVETLKIRGLAECIKFYKGSPTCFTVIADGQKLMLVNPYPYQREAYNSWCIVLRDSVGGVYSDFKKAHFDEPWVNPQLAMPYNEECYQALLSFYEKSVDLAKEQMLNQIGKAAKKYK
jgi:hypothetical protein